MSSNERIDYNNIHTLDFEAGYDDAWTGFNPDEPVGDPVSNEDYRFGWWCGIGEATAWLEGYRARENGLLFCPYVLGSDDECFRPLWIAGYAAAMGMDLEYE